MGIMHVVGYLWFFVRLRGERGEGTMDVRLGGGREGRDHAYEWSSACPESGKVPHYYLLDTGIRTSELLSGHMQIPVVKTRPDI